MHERIMSASFSSRQKKLHPTPCPLEKEKVFIFLDLPWVHYKVHVGICVKIKYQE